MNVRHQRVPFWQDRNRVIKDEIMQNLKFPPKILSQQILKPTLADDLSFIENLHFVYKQNQFTFPQCIFCCNQVFSKHLPFIIFTGIISKYISALKLSTICGKKVFYQDPQLGKLHVAVRVWRILIGSNFYLQLFPHIKRRLFWKQWILEILYAAVNRRFHEIFVKSSRFEKWRRWECLFGSVLSRFFVLGYE